MSEGSSGLPPGRLKHGRIKKSYRSITSERQIVPGVLKALNAHKRSVRLVKRLLLKDMENEMSDNFVPGGQMNMAGRRQMQEVEEGNCVLLEEMTMSVRRCMKERVEEENSLLLKEMTMAVRRDTKVLKNLRRMGFEDGKVMKKMKNKLKVKGEKEDQEHEGEKGGGAKPEEKDGESGGDDASGLCADFMEDEEEDKEVDSGGDESDLYSSDTDNEALQLRKYIKEDDCTYCPSGKDKVDYRKWVRYYKQIRRSQGFDIHDFPGHCLNTRIVPLRNLEEDQQCYLKIIHLATNALDAFNSEKGKHYKFHKLVTVNYLAVEGMMYFVTFEARKPEAAYAVKTFQTKIYCRGGNQAKVQFCRKKKSFS